MRERPILFMKVGLQGAEPLGFYDVVADRYDADQHVLAEIASEYQPTPEPPRGRVRRLREYVRQTAIDRCVESLQAGTNAFYDGFLNSRNHRKTVTAVAQACGAQAAVLCVRAPQRLIEARLRERYEYDELYVPSSSTTIDTVLNKMRGMRRGLEWPDATEFAIRLKGNTTTEEMLGRVTAWLPVSGIEA